MFKLCFGSTMKAEPKKRGSKKNIQFDEKVLDLQVNE